MSGPQTFSHCLDRRGFTSPPFGGLRPLMDQQGKAVSCWASLWPRRPKERSLRVVKSRSHTMIGAERLA